MSQTLENTRSLATAMCLLWTSSPCIAQPAPTNDVPHAAIVNAIGLGLEPQTSTDEVFVLRFADFDVQTGLAVNEPLFEGDMIQGDREGLLIELRCNGGSLIKLSGRFRVALSARRAGQDCALNLLAGAVDVVTDERTEVNAGGRIMGSEGTRYAVDAWADNGATSVNLTVFEGAVSLRGAGEAQRIERMTTIALQSNAASAEPTAIPEAQLQQHARLLAEFDSIKAIEQMQVDGGEVDAEATVAYYTQLNQAVLSAPDDPTARLQLALAQTAIDRPEAAQYNFKRLGVDEEQLLDEAVMQRFRQETIRLVPPSDQRIELLLRREPQLRQQLDSFRTQQNLNRGPGG